MIYVWVAVSPVPLTQPREEIFAMHDLLIALAFVGLVVAPAIVASNTGAESDE